MSASGRGWCASRRCCRCGSRSWITLPGTATWPSANTCGWTGKTCTSRHSARSRSPPQRARCVSEVNMNSLLPRVHDLHPLRFLAVRALHEHRHRLVIRVGYSFSLRILPTLPAGSSASIHVVIFLAAGSSRRFGGAPCRASSSRPSSRCTSSSRIPTS